MCIYIYIYELCILYKLYCIIYISYYITLYNYIILYYNIYIYIYYYIILYIYIMSYYIMLFYRISYYIYITSHHITSHYITLHYIITTDSNRHIICCFACAYVCWFCGPRHRPGPPGHAAPRSANFDWGHFWVISSGNLTWQLKMAIYSKFSH